MTIEEIKEMPTEFMDQAKGKSHESVLRSYHVVEKVKDMAERKDSPETILEMINHLMGW